ncbi:MAG: hypothetical protein ACLT1K_03630 [[Clostridium] leptum]
MANPANLELAYTYRGEDNAQHGTGKEGEKKNSNSGPDPYRPFLFFSFSGEQAGFSCLPLG